jgi:signal transduction histidine kinase
MKLATQVSLTLVGVLALGILGSVEALLVAREMNRVLEGMIAENVSNVRAAEELEIALLQQNSLVFSHILDHRSTRWLTELQSKKSSFREWQAIAEGTATTPEEHGYLVDLRGVYEEYDGRRDQVIRLFNNGQADQAVAVLLGEVDSLYRRAYDSCEDFLAANLRTIDQRSALARMELRRASVAVAVLVALTIGSGVGLLILFFRGVLRPIRQMANDVRAFSRVEKTDDPAASFNDELRAVGFYLRSLMFDVTETQNYLERSRLELLNSEKLASLGRMAASIGHEIRNPLTSIEMRLFSVRQAVGENPEIEDDLRVVSEEIDHLEKTVRNFLEFSRPARPNLQAHNVPRLLDKTLELCGRWLEERGITVVREEELNLPPVTADAEQIKQVFLNLLRNSAEAMEEGGTITISASPAAGRGGNTMIVVRVQDTGPGIPPEVRERILEPFFSTKPEGTGLGLVGAAQIMAQHKGRLELEPPGECGASFAVWIPAALEG